MMLRAFINKRPRFSDDDSDNGDDCTGNILSEQTKRLKLTNTPGELRLQKDVYSLRNVPGIQITPSSISNSEIYLNFQDELVGLKCPSRFLVAARKYYPHSAPNIQCLDEGYYCEFIDKDGILLEAIVERNWTALCSLSDVLNILNGLRQQLYLRTDEIMDSSHLYSPGGVERVVSGGSADEIMDS